MPDGGVALRRAGDAPDSVVELLKLANMGTSVDELEEVLRYHNQFDDLKTRLAKLCESSFPGAFRAAESGG